MKKPELNDALMLKLNEFIKENEIELEEGINFETRLIGLSSIFDSIELVSFIVEIEQMLEEKFEFQTELASEKALSLRSSPFISLKTLSSYILDLYDE